jgi:hypothetical protein
VGENICRIPLDSSLGEWHTYSLLYEKKRLETIGPIFSSPLYHHDRLPECNIGAKENS